MAPSTVSEGSEAAVPAPFNKIGSASVQTYFQRIRKACGKWPWELFDEKRLSPHWTVYLLQKLHQAIKLAQSSPKISLTLVMEYLESIWIGEKKDALSKRRTSARYRESECPANNAQKSSASFPHNGDGDGTKSRDATLVHDKIVVAPSPSPPPRPRVYQDDNRDVTAPPFIDLTKSDSPEPPSNVVTETPPEGEASRVEKRKNVSEFAAGSVPAPKRQKKTLKPIHTPSGTLGMSHKDVRRKDITDDENAQISAIQNKADCVHAQQNENKTRLKMLNSSRELLQRELNTAQTDLTRIRQDIQDSTVIRDSVLRIIYRRTSEDVDGWNMALERCDKSLKIFKDDSKKTTDVLNKKKQDLKNVDEMVRLAKREIEKCTQQAGKLLAQLDESTCRKTASGGL
ncbi:hypothetical protein FVEG_17665 [Fusarium verticillioides 7600]|uniref:Uncharacterized protein n=1 Tax=Gibberella moniliformis (strain M3125 / FGSC 7600) TaxID=334819 RepID=A0A139YBX3_GIBM7|nr:hypothetical protein FVEG_17665 [Fusarium verticillioides 7600]KYG13657.1 hypothetical protein FVEG_17665 [Fusarium verticillioides 7600]